MTQRPGACVLLAILLALSALLQPMAAAHERPGDIEADLKVLVMVRQAPTHMRAGGGYGGGYGDEIDRAERERLGRRIARAHGLTLVEEWPMPMIGIDCLVMAIPTGASAEAVAAELSRDKAVDWAEPMRTYHTLAEARTPNDPLYAIEPAARLWHLADLHQFSTGRGVKVAVIDTRVDTAQPDLVGQFTEVQDFVPDHPAPPEAHGTGVAGIIAAREDNGIGIVGIAPGARIMALRACWQEAGGARSDCESLGIAKAVHFALEHDAQIINLSLGGPPDRLIAQLLDLASERGAVVVAAWNASAPNGGFPASHSGVVAVSADTPAPARRDAYSAPGHDIPTTQPGSRWFLVNGSSYAAAHVSGLLALSRGWRNGGTSGAWRRLIYLAGSGGQIDARATLMHAKGCLIADGCGDRIVHPGAIEAVAAQNSGSRRVPGR